jgi:hypothetical protein
MLFYTVFKKMFEGSEFGSECRQTILFVLYVFLEDVIEKVWFGLPGVKLRQAAWKELVSRSPSFQTSFKNHTGFELMRWRDSVVSIVTWSGLGDQGFDSWLAEKFLRNV